MGSASHALLIVLIHPLEYRPRHSASSTFSARPRPNELLETLNAHLDPADGVPRGLLKQRVQMGAKGRREEWECKSSTKGIPFARALTKLCLFWLIDRYMFEKVSERSNSTSPRCPYCFCLRVLKVPRFP